MKRTVKTATLVILGVATIMHQAHAATIRIGEQDSCKVTGVTAVQSDVKASQATVTFDLTGVKAAGEVTDAKLRLWVTVGGRAKYPEWWAIEKIEPPPEGLGLPPGGAIGEEETGGWAPLEGQPLTDE